LKKLSRKFLVLVLFILTIFCPLDKNNERGGIDNYINHPQISRHDYLWSYQVISSKEDYFKDSAISSDGTYLVVGTADSSNPPIGRVYLFHKSNPTPLWNYTHTGTINSVAISADGNYIVAGGYLYLYLFHKSDSTPLWNFSGPTAAVRSVAISADGNYIVAAARGVTYKSTIWLFHRSSSTPQWSYTDIGPDGTYLADISADGNYVIAGFAYGLSFFERSNPTPLWSYSTGLESGGGERVQSIAISANGDFITMGSKNNKIYSFHKSNSSPLWKYNTTVILTICVDISSDGKFISAGIQNGMFYIFNTTNNFPIFRYRAKSVIPYEDGTTMVEFSTPSFCILGFYGKLYSFNSTDNWDVVQVSELYEFNQAIQTTAISSNSDYIIVGIRKIPLVEAKNHVYLFGNFYRNILPSSNHPDDLIIKEGLMNSTITWKLYDDLGSDPFCQSFTINYSRLIEKDGIKYYEFTFKTNKYYDDDYLMLCNNNQVNSIFYESFQIEYFERKDLVTIVTDYLSKDLYEIDYLNNSLIMPNASQNPITQINNIKDFNLEFRINDLYRVKRSEENGSNLIWVNWDQWYSDNNVFVSVDSSKSGIYNYTIEYFDNNLQFGISDSVIVIIEEASDEEGSQSTNFSISSFNPIIFLISGVLVSIYLFYSVKKSEKGANYFN